MKIVIKKQEIQDQIHFYRYWKIKIITTNWIQSILLPPCLVLPLSKEESSTAVRKHKKDHRWLSSSDCENLWITILFPTTGIFFNCFDWDFVVLLIWVFWGEGVSFCVCFFIYLLWILLLEVFCPKSGFNVKLCYEGQSKLEDVLGSWCVPEELRTE